MGAERGDQLAHWEQSGSTELGRQADRGERQKADGGERGDQLAALGAFVAN